jgi:phytoene desaturase
MVTTRTAVVIGAGIAGLATAIRLSVEGFKVTVFEKNNYPGGKLSAFEKNGFHFDAGPSLFTQPENIEELFLLAGEPIDKYFRYQKTHISCKYFYEDGIVVNAFSDKVNLLKELQEKLGEEPKRVNKYLQAAEKLYNNIAEVFLNHSLHERATFFNRRIIPALRTVGWKHIARTLDQYNRSYFKHPHTVQLFNRFATYNGSNPFKAPGMLGLIPHLEMNQGTFFPAGGMISITNALYKLAQKKGVQFRFNEQVNEISIEDKSAKAIIVNGLAYKANVVVSNMDVYYTYQHLLNNPAAAKKVLKQERSSSALIFYWGINKIFPELALHNIFFSKNYEEEFRHLFTLKTLFNDPTIYINNTSTIEKAQAPPGKENWFVMVNAPSHAGQNWEHIKQETRRHIIEKLNRMLGTNLEKHIEVEECLDPLLIEQLTASHTGSLYGTSSNSAMAAFFRHPNFSADIQNLYFCGGSVHPGGGIPLCLKSAKIVSNLIVKNNPFEDLL